MQRQDCCCLFSKVKLNYRHNIQKADASQPFLTKPHTPAETNTLGLQAFIKPPALPGDGRICRIYSSTKANNINT